MIYYSSNILPIAFLLCMFSSALVSQTYWSQRFDLDNGNDTGVQIQEINDGLIVLSNGLCDMNDRFCVGIIKLDIDGHLIWRKVYYDTIDINSLEPMKIRDDTIFINMHYKNISDKYYTVLMLNMDGEEIGRIDYEHESSSYHWSRDFEIGQTIQYVNFSFRDITTNYHRSGVFAFDNKWNKLWTREFPNILENIAFSDIEITDDLGVVILYTAWEISDSVSIMATIERYNSAGNCLWKSTLPYVYDTKSKWVKIATHPDGGFVGLWQIDSFGLYIVDEPSYIFKLNSNGIVEWSKIDWLENQVILYDIFSTKSGDIIVCGTEENNAWNGEHDVYFAGYIAKYSSEGDKLFEKRIFDYRDAGKYFQLYGGMELNTGDLIFTGEITDTLYKTSEDSLPLYPVNTWVIKLDSNGCLTSNCEDDLILSSNSISLISENSAFNIFPNPSNDYFILDHQTNGILLTRDISATLIDMNGRICDIMPITELPFRYNYTDKLSSGLYILKISIDGTFIQNIKMVIH